MARKTKAELTAEREAAHQARYEVAKATYTQRMMAVLERAVKENFELEVRDGKFRVEDRDDRRFGGTFYLPPAWDEMADVDLFQLEVSVELKEEARAEREQKAQARAVALSKLSQEERELLGL
jgi:hypothetical protein